MSDNKNLSIVFTTGDSENTAPVNVDCIPDLSDDQLALDLGLAGFNTNARFVTGWGWLLWNGSCWQKDGNGRHITSIRHFLRATAKNYEDWADKKVEAGSIKNEVVFRRSVATTCNNLRSKRTVEAVEKLVRSNPQLVASPDQFDANSDLLGTPGGTVDLRTGDLREARREDYITKQVAIIPAAKGAQPVAFLNFLDRVFGGDAELIAFIRRAAGYALTGSTREHKLLFLYGTGRNGKSVFLNTLLGMLSDYSRRAPSNLFLDARNESHPTSLAGLMGARLVVGSELPPGKTWNETMIKDLTGGDVVTARFMRQDFFDYLPQFTLMIAGNHQPSFRGIDEAIRARVCLVPFEVTIPEDERDPELENKLKDEWSEILRWAIDGAVEWQKQGLNPPERVLAASEEYLESEDLFGQFLSETTVEDKRGEVTSKQLFIAYQSWAVGGGLKPWSSTAFGKAMTERGYERIKIAKARGYSGLKLSENPEM